MKRLLLKIIQQMFVICNCTSYNEYNELYELSEMYVVSTPNNYYIQSQIEQKSWNSE